MAAETAATALKPLMKERYHSEEPSDKQLLFAERYLSRTALLTFGTGAVSYLVPSLSPVPERIMPAGYTTYRTSCGHVHVHCLQTKSDECGEACMGMVIAMKTSRYLDLGTLRSSSQSHGGLYYRPGVKDAGAPVNDPRYAAMATLLRKGAAPDVGTGLGNLVDVLQEYGVAAVRHGNGAAAQISTAASAGRLAIAQVEWSDSGSHFIVVHGQDKNKYCILDPGHQGVVQTEASGSLTYSAPYGSSGRFIACAVIT